MLYVLFLELLIYDRNEDGEFVAEVQYERAHCSHRLIADLGLIAVQEPN